MIKVTIWNENVHEREQNAVGDYIRKIYPNGIHQYLKDALKADDLEIRAVSMDMPQQGLPESLLEDTDVLMWWGHVAHDQVDDALVARIQARIHKGMGLIVMHSGHYSKIFKRMMGTTCSLHWREIGEKERVWRVAPANHPIVQGVPETFVIPNSEMYGERFDIPDDGQDIFISWYEGGNIFRSGVLFQRGPAKVFYFSPGHETYPIYHDANVQKVLSNAIRFVAPTYLPDWNENIAVPHETVTTPNPLADLDTSALHK